jgi:uncharacterized protein YhaN
MKKAILMISIIIISLTSCTSTDSADINVFIERYNKISEISILKENIHITTENDQKYYSVFPDKNTILRLKANKDCEIIECIITTSGNNYSKYLTEISMATLIAITDCDKSTAEQIFSDTQKNNTVLNDYEVIRNTDNVQLSIIIKKTDNKTTNDKTLTEYIKHKNKF